MMNIEKRSWEEITTSSKKSVRGWIAVVCKDLSQKIVWHDQIDDTMLFYYPLPLSLTQEQFEKTDPWLLQKKEEEK